MGLVRPFYCWNFPGGSNISLVVKHLPEVWETQVRSLGQEDPLEKEMATHSSILAWKIPMDRGAWWATVHGVTELDTTEHSTTGCLEMYKRFSSWLGGGNSLNSILFYIPTGGWDGIYTGGSFKQDLNGKKGWKELNFWVATSDKALKLSHLINPI